MEIREALQWTDELIFAKTDTHLDSLQRAILQGVWEHKEYKDIAEEYHCSSEHVKKTAAGLWKLISDSLGEDVKKKNVRSLIENGIFSYYNDQVHIGSQIGSQINVCSDPYNHPKSKNNPSVSNKKTQPPHDLSQAPGYDQPPYNRSDQITNLKHWILEENSRIVTLTGLSGMGKTTLARQLIEEIKDHFDRILWCNHRKFPTLNALQNKIITFLAPHLPIKDQSIVNYLNCRNTISEYLTNHRCLIVLDNFQETLMPGELVGNYRPEYENCGQLLTEIGQLDHHSCFLILSWEKPLELITLESQNSYCKNLTISGLGKSATQLLTARKLKDKNYWSELIELYGDNPLWLNTIAHTILDLFAGSVANFLDYSHLYLGDLEQLIKPHYQRLSAAEKTLLQWLVQQEKPMQINQHNPDFLSNEDFLKVIQSLKRRNLLEKFPLLTLQPAIQQYIKNQINLN